MSKGDYIDAMVPVYLNAKLKHSGGKNQVIVKQGVPPSCIKEVPAAPSRAIGTCSYYYRPSKDDLVNKSGVNGKEVLAYAIRIYKSPAEALDVFKRLVTQKNRLIAPESTDPNWSRWHNFKARHNGCGHEPPTYYMSYGYYYCRNFSAHLITRMQSQEGLAWVVKARELLHEYMEKGFKENAKKTVIRTPSRLFEGVKGEVVHVDLHALELDDKLFKDFAFNSHVAAYLDAGFAEVPVADLVRVFGQPDVDEFTDLATWKQVKDVAWEVIPEKFKHPGKTVAEVGDAGFQLGKHIVVENINDIKNKNKYIIRKIGDAWQWVSK